MSRDPLREIARASCIAAGIDPDSRPDGREPAWVARRNEMARANDGAKAATRAAVAADAAPSSKPLKPLNAKAYGSIGHLPSSRLGTGDWSVTKGMARIATEKPRRGDRVIVTEKLDGACVSVANVDGRLIALSRAGFAAADALYPHLRAFAPYVGKRIRQFEWLQPGERIVGEWLALAHGTMYDVTHPDWAPFIRIRRLPRWPARAAR